MKKKTRRENNKVATKKNAAARYGPSGLPYFALNLSQGISKLGEDQELPDKLAQEQLEAILNPMILRNLFVFSRISFSHGMDHS